ncbi:MAG: hypothetical protein ACKERG_03490 [Candidatus Hodgkinia cicadicola]
MLVKLCLPSSSFSKRERESALECCRLCLSNLWISSSTKIRCQ